MVNAALIGGERPRTARSGRLASALAGFPLSTRPVYQMTQLNMRAEVKELQKLGPLPSEDGAEVAQLKKIEELYRAIAKPLTDDEARVLVELFGPDGCFGLASSFMHLIETSPGWPLKDCFQNLDNEWKVELRNRAIRGGYQL